MLCCVHALVSGSSLAKRGRCTDRMLWMCNVRMRRKGARRESFSKVLCYTQAVSCTFLNYNLTGCGLFIHWPAHHWYNNLSLGQYLNLYYTIYWKGLYKYYPIHSEVPYRCNIIITNWWCVYQVNLYDVKWSMVSKNTGIKVSNTEEQQWNISPRTVTVAGSDSDDVMNEPCTFIIV